MFESTLAPEYTPAAHGRLAKWQANRAIGYVDAHLDARLKVSEIANVVHLSSSHFSRAFKRAIGRSPAEFRQQRRRLSPGLSATS